MFLFRNKKIISYGFILLSLCTGHAALAAPNDEFLHTEPNIDEPNFRSEVGYDLMNDAVDIFNLRTRQGPVSAGTGDYHGGHVMLGYNLSPNWSTEASYWNRNIEYGSTGNEVNSWLVSAYYDPFALPMAQDRAVFRFSVWGDQANNLSKNSSTVVNGKTFNQITVQNPSDIQAQLDAIFSSILNERNLLTGFVSAGVSRVDVGNVDASLKRGNCTFNVNINSDNVAAGTLAAPCVVSGGGQLLNASFTENSTAYGIDINKDLNYTASYFELGGSWRWKYQRFTTNLGYQFQYLRRSGVDKRVSSFGGSPVTSNHTLGLDVAYKLTKQLDFFAQAQVFKNNFVGTIPFLYNSITASRLDRSYGYMGVGLRYSGF